MDGRQAVATPVIPAKAGIQLENPTDLVDFRYAAWTPAFAGVTGQVRTGVTEQVRARPANSVVIRKRIPMPQTW